mmetsp:Transcript_15663/g.24005  ORF Transcript_15663/g.24005 Transcript_15663/m.24005 type:complete len:103 (+) Transcript_15663:1689-1997(+)
MPKEALIEKCIAEGKGSNRADDIIQYSMSHSGGYIYVYVNSTGDSTLNETLSFDKEGLDIVGQDDQEKCEFSVGPGEQHVIELKKTGGGWALGSSCSYSISS